jgi:hypothetical protein
VLTEQNIRAGVPPQEALRAARIEHQLVPERVEDDRWASTASAVAGWPVRITADAAHTSRPSLFATSSAIFVND